MTELKEFKKELVFTDQKKIDNGFRSARELAASLNDGMAKAKALLGDDLSDEVLTEILENGNPHVMELLKAKFQFPDSDLEFNLKAMGASKKDELDASNRALSGCAAKFGAYCFIVKDCAVQLTKEGENAIQESGNFYTANDAQNTAFELSKRLVKELGEAYDMGYIDNTGLNQIERVTGLVKAVHATGFRVNHGYIKRIGENGKVMG